MCVCVRERERERGVWVPLFLQLLLLLLLLLLLYLHSSLPLASFTDMSLVSKELGLTLWLVKLGPLLVPGLRVVVI